LGRRGDAEVQTAMALARELRDVALPEDPDDVAQLLQRLLRSARESGGMFFLQGSGGGSLSLLLDILERFFPGESAALGAALLAGGEPSVTARQGFALLELARAWRASTTPAAPLEDPAFRAAFTAFLDEYGHRGHYETYLRSPRWREQPERLLEQLPGLADVDAGALRARQKAAADAAWARVRRELPFWCRPLLRGAVRAATRDSNRREAARSALVALLAPARRLWLMIGARLVTAGALEAADDVFLLLPSEIERHARGELLHVAGVRARVAQRAAQFENWQRTTAPEWLTLSPGGELRGVDCAPAVAPLTPGSTVLRGVATGTGVARGRVRRLRHPREGLALLPGEILVAPSTDPGWTPLFLKAGGLVVETGGYMSHGAIVAREFALPTVVNLPGILDVLADGEEIVVDGLRGEVTRLAGA
jgi:pyruvate,water dikinase